jgi:hypothetical protein
MSDDISVTTTYIGLVDGLHTYEVRDAATDQVVGYNRCPYPPCPGDGWVLDENTCSWILAGGA